MGLPSSYLADKNSRFATTRWSLVAAARAGDAVARDALSELCNIYWKPVFCFIRRQRKDQDEALDLAQEFFARLLEKRDFGAAQPDRGRFRSYLLGAVRHFLANQHAKARTLKRGGGSPVFSLDQAVSESGLPMDPPDLRTPEMAYNRKWAESLIESVLAGLRAQYQNEGKEQLFAALAPLLSANSEMAAYREIAGALGTTESAIKSAAHRIRKRYRQLLKETVAETVAEPEEIEDEIRFLIQALE